MPSTQKFPTALSTLAILWSRLEERGPAQAGPAGVKRLAQALGDQAMRCVSDSMNGRRHDLVRDSAAVLDTLVSLWAACGLSPDEIWTELFKREQLGSLLMQLNRAQDRVPRRLLKPWRVDSTKLP